MRPHSLMSALALCLKGGLDFLADVFRNDSADIAFVCGF